MSIANLILGVQNNPAPAWFSAGKTTASDGVNYAEYGNAVALSADGNTLVVGAHRQDVVGRAAGTGQVYVYKRQGSIWVEQQKLAGSRATTGGDDFGRSVAISADGLTIAVGAPNQTLASPVGAGAVYVFSFNGTTWSEQWEVEEPMLTSIAAFGFFVSLSNNGNTLLAGAPDQRVSGVDSVGSAYVYTRSGTTWTREVILPGSTAYAGKFGCAGDVSATGNACVIGARNADNGNGTRGGNAYFYTRSGTTWTLQTTLGASSSAPAGGSGMQFGTSCSMSDDGLTTYITGRRTNTVGGFGELWKYSGGLWNFAGANLSNMDTDPNNGSGFSGAITADGNQTMLGAPSLSRGGISGRGAVDLVYWNVIGPTSQFLGDNNYMSLGYTCAMSASGDVCVVGAPGADPSSRGCVITLAR